MGSESYGAFAYAYDQALGRRFFGAVQRLLVKSLEERPPAEKTHLDVACGTGYAMELFARRGFRSVGVDLSVPMLRIARTRVRRLVCADMRALPLRRTFARITCLYDSLNHLKERDDLAGAFRAVRAQMSAESLFLFDINHPDIYPEVWGSKEPFVASGADYRLEIDTMYRKRERLARALVSGWAKLRGTRVEIREEHEQRAWSKSDVRAALREAGLEVVEVVNFDPYDERDAIDAETVKLFFTCRVANSWRSDGSEDSRRRTS
ncbi:MAG TPA: methyltransferase domain-containing protein [Thermoanaerobaculia bacterium]|nr:methyltransferase domain-containing protein [Thermoanaerobaculia bacterium]